MDINTELLDKLRSALRREMALVTGIATEVIHATTYLARVATEEREAQRRAAAWPNDPRHDSLSPRELNDIDLAAMEQRRALRHVEKVAGRPAINEQSTLRDHAEAARRAGVDVGVAAAMYARASAGVDPQLLQQAWETAITARVKAERQLAELEDERAQHGRRAGQLRATLQEAARWLQANGMVMEPAA